MNIGKTIARIRKKRNISRKELAQKTGVPYQTLNNIEAGRVKEPGIVALVRIAQVLEVSLDTLILDKLSKRPKITIPYDIYRILQNREVKKFFSVIEAIDVKGIRNLKRIAKYFHEIIDEIEIKKKNTPSSDKK